MKVILISTAAAVLYEAAVMIRCYRAAYRNYKSKPLNCYGSARAPKDVAGRLTR